MRFLPSIRFLIASAILALCMLVAVIAVSGFDRTRHIAIHYFGGITSVFGALAVIVVVIGIYLGLYFLSQARSPHVTAAIGLMLTIVTGLVGVGWIHINVSDMFLPLVAILVAVTSVAAPTAAIMWLARR